MGNLRDNGGSGGKKLERRSNKCGGIQRGDLKGHRTDCSNTSTHTLELCAWATEDVILHLRLATLRKQNKKLTDENPVNEGLNM